MNGTGILHLALDAYFAATLGIAGLAKYDSLGFFIEVLHYQYGWPARGAGIGGRLIPLLEMLLALALLLAAGVLKLVATALVLALFAGFLFFQIRWPADKATTLGCGCFGRYARSRGVNVNRATSGLQFLMALILLMITCWTAPLPWPYYLLLSLLYVAAMAWLACRVLQRRRQMATTRQLAVTILPPGA